MGTRAAQDRRIQGTEGKSSGNDNNCSFKSKVPSRWWATEKKKQIQTLGLFFLNKFKANSFSTSEHEDFTKKWKRQETHQQLTRHFTQPSRNEAKPWDLQGAPTAPGTPASTRRCELRVQRGDLPPVASACALSLESDVLPTCSAPAWLTLQR